MDLININYESESGDSPIRTICNNDILYFSLSDVLQALARENEVLGESNKSAHIPKILSTVLKTLESDEFIRQAIDHQKPDETEMFLTQPGLLRLMSANDSKSARKFQRWLFHEVVPSILKHGTYPPPASSGGSALAQMAEMLAQNTRALADTILQTEKLESEVKNVQVAVGSIDHRVAKLEQTAPSIKYAKVFDRLKQHSMSASPEQQSELAAWCENFALRDEGCKVLRNSKTDARENEYPIDVIDIAIQQMKKLARL